MKEKRKLSLRQLFSYLIIGLIVLIALTIIVVLVFGILHLKTNDAKYIVLLICFASFFTICLLGYIAFLLRYMFKVFYQELYTTSLRNLEELANQKNKLTRYNQNSVVYEFQNLNDIIDQLEARYDNIIITNRDFTYNHIQFDYVDGYQDVVSYNSFVKYASELVYVAQAFRNAFISFTYDLKDRNRINEEEMQNFVRMAHTYLPEKGMVIADNSAKSEFIVYVPNIDSMSKLQSDVQNVLENISVIRKTGDGANIVVCHASIIVYPYSNLEDVIADIRYANRQGKVINLYIPNKKTSDNDKVLENSMNLNSISRLYELFSAIDVEKNSSQKATAQLQRVISMVCQYFNFDQAGYARFNEFDDLLLSEYAYARGDNKPLFSEGNPIETQFIELIDEIKDEDKSYYFSRRRSADQDLGRFLDKYGLESGHFFLITDSNKPVGLVYFVKKTESFLNSYLRESLLVFSHYIASIVKEISEKEEVDKTNKRFNDILKISGYNLYAIEKDTKKLTLLSESLREMFPEAKLGQYCYKALYGKNKPCENCPLATGKKMYDMLKDTAYESSLALNVSRSREAQILLTPDNNGSAQARDRFDKDLLINSSYSLIETLQNSYALKGRGYLIHVSIDNYDELMDYYSNEELNLYVRRFTTAIRGLNPDKNNIFAYNQNSFVIILSEAGKNDAIELVEKIYPLSQRNFMEDMTDVSMKLSYYIHAYPAEYENAADLLKSLEKKTSEFTNMLGQDMILIPDSKFARPASEEKYIISILDTAINEDSFSIKLQPIVTKRKKIVGAEILLRFADSYRNVDLNVANVINIANSSNRITLITDALIERIGEFYSKHGALILGKYNFTKLTLNTNFSFFQDESFISKIAELRQQYNIPENFLTFEVPESEVYEHYTQFEELARAIIKNNIVLYVDNYTGSLLNLDKVKEIGFSGVKIDRSIVNEMGNDPSKKNIIISFLESCTLLNLDCTVVGIETMSQYNLLKDDQHSFDMQGFYFHKPQDSDALIANIEKFNR